MQTPFFQTLIAAGIPPAQAQELEPLYQNEPDFLDGLESIAQCLALKQTPNLAPPAGEPWRLIHTSMLQDIQGGVDLDTAFSNALAPYPPQIQLAITNSVSVRMKVILDFEAQKGSQKRVKTKDYITQLKHLNYSFKLNELDDTIEVNSVPLTDPIAAQIRAQMRDAGFYRVQEMEDAYLAHAYHHRYHPIREFLASLQYDGGKYIDELASYFTDKYNMFPTWIRKWLIGACAKAFNAEQNPMLVLDGVQGIGKSEFVKWLSKPISQYFTEGAINTDDKDCVLRLAKYWIWEVSELGSTTRKADYEALKAFLTTRKITVRKPYGHTDIIKPALCNFIGTINNSNGIFSDPTGSRRFLVSNLTQINWDYAKLDPTQIWSEAIAAYLAGEQWQLSLQERKTASTIASQYDIEDPIEDLIKKFFEIDPAQEKWWISTVDILSILENPYQGALRGTSRGNAMGLAAAMTKLGLEKVRGYNGLRQRVWGYSGIRLGNTP